MAQCMKCGRDISGDEIGLHRKMINRGASEWMCITCLAGFFNCTEELLLRKMEQFREQGCMLFAPKK